MPRSMSPGPPPTDASQIADVPTVVGALAGEPTQAWFRSTWAAVRLRPSFPKATAGQIRPEKAGEPRKQRLSKWLASASGSHGCSHKGGSHAEQYLQLEAPRNHGGPDLRPPGVPGCRAAHAPEGCGVVRVPPARIRRALLHRPGRLLGHAPRAQLSGGAVPDSCGRCLVWQVPGSHTAIRQATRAAKPLGSGRQARPRAPSLEADCKSGWTSGPCCRLGRLGPLRRPHLPDLLRGPHTRPR